MNYDIICDEDRDLFIVRTEGAIDIDTETLIISELLAHPKWKKHCHLLFDYSNSTLGHLQVVDIQKLSEMIKGYSGQLGKIKFAMVMKSDLNFGLGRMWEAYTSSYVECEISVFRTNEEAESWLMPGISLDSLH